MQDLQSIGRWLVAAGIGIVLVGGLLILFGRWSGLQNLPGTIKVEREGFSCMIPLVASILISVVLTVLLNLIGRISNR